MFFYEVCLYQLLYLISSACSQVLLYLALKPCTIVWYLCTSKYFLPTLAWEIQALLSMKVMLSPLSSPSSSSLSSFLFFSYLRSVCTNTHWCPKVHTGSVFPLANRNPTMEYFSSHLECSTKAHVLKACSPALYCCILGDGKNFKKRGLLEIVRSLEAYPWRWIVGPQHP